MSVLNLIAGPHLHSMFTIPRVMVAVALCLSPATAFGLYQFGWPAVFLFAITVGSALVFEALCLLAARRPVGRFLSDGSALLSGWLVAMTLPPWAPWWVGVTGAGIAIVLAKHAFGGLGQNLFNPAMVARAMLLVALPVQMTTWVVPTGGHGIPFDEALSVTFGGRIPFDAISSASTLGHMQSALDAGALMPDILTKTAPVHDVFYGMTAGSLGETSALLLLLGGIALILLRIITVVIPLSVLGTLFLLSGAAYLIDPAHFAPPLYQLSTGAIMLCAFFIATDYVTSPITGAGKALYGIGIGTLVFVIRTWGAFPEGVAFAVLLMNACTPLIDTYLRPRIFGRTRKGDPIKPRTNA